MMLNSVHSLSSSLGFLFLRYASRVSIVLPSIEMA